MTPRDRVGLVLTRRQRQILKDLVAGGVILAAYREPEDFASDGRMFPGYPRVGHPRLAVFPAIEFEAVAPKTMQFFVENGLVGHEPGVSGDREWSITQAGRIDIERSE